MGLRERIVWGGLGMCLVLGCADASREGAQAAEDTLQAIVGDAALLPLPAQQTLRCWTWPAEAPILRR